MQQYQDTLSIYCSLNPFKVSQYILGTKANLKHNWNMMKLEERKLIWSKVQQFLLEHLQ